MSLSISKIIPLSVGLCILLVLGCSKKADELEKSPGVASLRATIKTAIPLGYATSVAVRAIQGESLAGVTTTNTCAIFPCVAAVTIAAKAGAFPAQLEKYGKIVVLGFWGSATSAILSVSYTNMDAGIDTFRVTSVGPVPVEITPTGVSIVYVKEDINVNVDPSLLSDAVIQAELSQLAMERPSSPDARVSLNVDAWIIDVDGMKTPNDFSDDQYHIFGAGQYVDASAGANTILQLVMIDSIVSNSCVANPTSGYAVINQVGANSKSELFPVFLGTATLRFRSRCDGTAAVDVALGDYFKSMGDQVSLGL